MTIEWKDLPTFQDVAEAQAQGWEIQTDAGTNNFAVWVGKSWHARWDFRGRPRQPAMKRVKQLCFFSASGIRYEVLEDGEQHNLLKNFQGWIRVPSEDKEIEVPE